MTGVKSVPLWSLMSFLAGEGVQLSGWQNKHVAIALWVIAAMLALYASWKWAFLPFAVKFRLSGLRALSFGHIMPLPEADRIVYDALRGTAIRKFVDRNFDSVDGKLQAIAGYVASTEARLFGKVPAGAVLVPIDKGDLASGIFHSGGSEFKQHGSQAPMYLDISIRRSDVNRVIRELKAISKELPS